MSLARRIEKKVVYNGIDISDYVQSITYTDNTDSTDDITLKLVDRAKQWYEEWFPETGDTLTVSINLINWTAMDTVQTVDFGIFEVDNVEMSDVVTINAVSAPITSSIRSETKTKGWEKIKLSNIAREIASSAALEFIYDTDVDPYYDRQDQNNKSDLSFLEELCKSDGLCVKVSDGQLIIFDESKYDTLPAVGTLEYSVTPIVGNPKFKRNAKNIYTACEITFTDSKTEKTYQSYFEAPNVGNIGHVLKLNESYNSTDDDVNLERKAKARLREQNKNEWTLNATLTDGAVYYAGTNLEVKGWFKFDGRYHIKTAGYNVSDSGFTVDLSMRKCLEGY